MLVVSVCEDIAALSTLSTTSYLISQIHVRSQDMDTFKMNECKQEGGCLHLRCKFILSLSHTHTK